uniref:Uncharacterized protein n=1 Tax=Anguilla anguilla TaxID=7936 RepID=A0A0E9UH26_ANGAN
MLSDLKRKKEKKNRNVRAPSSPGLFGFRFSFLVGFFLLLLHYLCIPLLSRSCG